MSDTPPIQPPEPDALWAFPQRSFSDSTFAHDARLAPAPETPPGTGSTGAPIAAQPGTAAPHTAVPPGAAAPVAAALGRADDNAYHSGAVGGMTYQPPPSQAAKRNGWGKRAGGGGVLVAAIAKFWVAFKSIAILLKAKTALSMVISIGIYTLFWGWKFAVGFVIILFIHEMGHVVVLRAQGIKATAPMFIPMLGAFISYKTPPRSVAQEATSALAGPFAGLLASGAALMIAEALDSPLLRAIAYTGFFLNLFNLLPALPLDGGRVAGALHPAVWFAGMLAVVAFLIWRPTPILILVLILGGFEAFKRWRAYRSGANNIYYTVSTAIRWRIAGAYVGVAVLCIAGMAYSFIPGSSLS